MVNSAIFSPDRRYRYELTRSWGSGKMLGFVMLNPSTANEETNDPTVCRCIGFAKAWGYETVKIVNLFAVVSSDPSVLHNEPDILQPDEEPYLNRLAVFASQIIAGWGTWGSYYPKRISQVIEIMTNCRDLYCFGWTKGGQPRHPLYIKMMPEKSLPLYQPFRGTRVDHSPDN